MALLKSKQIKAMNKEQRFEKLKDLKLELIKANLTANKTNAKTKEIKRAIARIITFNHMENLSKPKVKKLPVKQIINTSKREVLRKK